MDRASRVFLAACLGAIAAAVALTFLLPSGSTPVTSAKRLTAAHPQPAVKRLRRTPRPRGIPVALTIGSRPTGRLLGGDYLGLALTAQAASSAMRSAHAVSLLRSIGHGQLQIEGAAPEAASASGAAGLQLAISPAQLKGLAALAEDAQWNVVLTAELMHPQPTAAASQLAAARRVLGSRLTGVQIGSEPDRYAGDRLRARRSGPSSYTAELNAYASAIAATAKVPTIAPDVALGAPRAWRWLKAAAAAHAGELSAIIQAPAGCEQQALDSASASAVDAGLLSRFAALAQRAGLSSTLEVAPPRCGTQPPIADALWASALIGQAMRVGITHVSFADPLTATQPTGPLLAVAASNRRAAEALEPGAEWYAMLIASRLLGQRPLPVAAQGLAVASGELSAQAFEGRSGAVHLLLVDRARRGSRPLAVHIVLPGSYRKGAILRLTGTAASSGGVELGGAAVSRSGQWHPRLPLPAVYGRTPRFSVEMPPSSAALITLAPRRR